MGSCDSINGYACEFQVYVGRPPGVKTEVGLGKCVVLELTEKLIGTRSHIYFDNYFNSVGLKEKLLERQLYGCGTVKSNVIGLPEMMHVKKRKRGDPPPLKLRPEESKIWQKGEILAIMWQENKSHKPVRVLSSVTNPTVPVTAVKRKEKDGTLKDISCQEPIKLYNMFMNGVDRSDQMQTEYSTARSCRRWWTYTFWFLVDLSISNSFILMNVSPDHQQLDECGRNKRTMLFLHQQLAKQLMSSYRKGRKRKRSVRPDVSGAGHWPLKLEKKKIVRSPAVLVNPDLSALAAVIFNGKSMHICVYNDITVSMRITHKLMTRPKFVNMYNAARDFV